MVLWLLQNLGFFSRRIDFENQLFNQFVMDYIKFSRKELPISHCFDIIDDNYVKKLK